MTNETEPTKIEYIRDPLLHWREERDKHEWCYRCGRRLWPGETCGCERTRTWHEDDDGW